MKKKAKHLEIKCLSCNEPAGTVESIFNKLDNEWDPDDPTEWVKQKLEAHDLGVLTHYHISCTTTSCPDFGKEIAVIKMEFVDKGKSKLEFKGV